MGPWIAGGRGSLTNDALPRMAGRRAHRDTLPPDGRSSRGRRRADAVGPCGDAAHDLEESGADPDLLVDLAQVRGELVDDATDAPNCRGLRASPPP